MLAPGRFCVCLFKVIPKTIGWVYTSISTTALRGFPMTLGHLGVMIGITAALGQCRVRRFGPGLVAGVTVFGACWACCWSCSATCGSADRLMTPYFRHQRSKFLPVALCRATQPVYQSKESLGNDGYEKEAISLLFFTYRSFMPSTLIRRLAV